MKFLIGVIIIMVSILASYVLMGGSFRALMQQPGEALIIIGSGVGSFIIANSRYSIFTTLKELKNVGKVLPNDKQSYKELLLFLYNAFKQIRLNGILSIEQFLDDPNSSEFFNKYPSFMKNKKAVLFFCDYIRLVSMGFKDHHQLEDLMNEEIEVFAEEGEKIFNEVNKLGDSMPALGIVAAVLGVIITMGKIGGDPAVLGKSIGSALIGTFLGILLSYAFINPIGSYLEKHYKSYVDYVKCIKIGILSHLKGNNPIISIEFVRKIIPEHFQPSFIELETLLSNEK